MTELFHVELLYFPIFLNRTGDETPQLIFTPSVLKLKRRNQKQTRTELYTLSYWPIRHTKVYKNEIAIFGIRVQKKMKPLVS